MNAIRIGQGYDIHQLVTDRKLIIGGITIPHDKGLKGHSDADVLLHAICDALIGAAALGDIGKHFSDVDAHFKDIDSRILIRNVFDLLNKNNFQIINIDSTIIAQAPKMAPHIPGMINNIAQDLNLLPQQINIKAKTAEHLGAIGKKEGIAAQAVCLINQSN